MGTPKNKHARRYYRVAKQRLAEAGLILEKLALPAAVEYLSGYAVECVLKALLIVLVPESERPDDWERIVEWIKKDFGHDLRDLRDEVQRRGLRLPKSESDSLKFVIENWKPESRYVPGLGEMAHARKFVAAVHKVVQWADRSI